MPATKDSAASISGTVTHALLSGDAPPREADRAERDRAAKCEEIAQKLVEREFLELCELDQVVCQREVRLWLRHGLQPVFSGQLDRLYHDPDQTHFLVIDFKTLYGEHKKAEDNWQIRAQAALVFENFVNAQFVTACIVQPESSQPPVTACFGTGDLIRLRGQLVLDLDKLNLGNPSYRAGSWCQYCPALAVCPLHKHQLAAIDPSVTNRWSLSTPREKLALYDACDRAEDFIKAVRSMVRADVESGDTYDGAFRLKPGRKTVKITDVAKAWELLGAELGLAEFNGACSISRPDLVDALRKAKDITKKEAEAMVDNRLAAIIEVSQAKQTLERIAQ